MLGEPVRDFSGKIIAWVEEKSNGDVYVREFSGMILGHYDKACDVTREFSGRIIAQGNQIGMLIGK